MKTLINWLLEPVYMKHIASGEIIKSNSVETLNDANKYHNNWIFVNRLQSWIN